MTGCKSPSVSRHQPACSIKRAPATTAKGPSRSPAHPLRSRRDQPQRAKQQAPDAIDGLENILPRLDQGSGHTLDAYSQLAEQVPQHILALQDAQRIETENICCSLPNREHLTVTKQDRKFRILHVTGPAKAFQGFANGCDRQLRGKQLCQRRDQSQDLARQAET